MIGVSAICTVDELLVKLALILSGFIASNENYRLTLRGCLKSQRVGKKALRG
jgi:hypothetical protein